MSRKWTPEQRAAASERAKQRIQNMEGTTPTIASPAVASYEQRPKRWSRPDDGFHYVLVEKKPTQNENDYRGWRLEEYDDMEFVAEMGTKMHDVYRIPKDEFNRRRKEKGDKSRKGAQAPVAVGLEGKEGRITTNTATESNQRPQEFFGTETESASA